MMIVFPRLNSMLNRLDQSAGSTQRMRPLTESVVLAPLLSVAGVNRARLRIRRHVVLSNELDPLEEVTEQLVTRPSGPTSSRNPVVPCSSLRMAESG